MNIAIIGAGLIGEKRAAALPQQTQLKIVCDINKTRANTLAERYNATSTTSWQEVVKSQDIEAIIICTTNNQLTPIAYEAITHSKHVLMEKPGARSYSELQRLLDIQKKSNSVVRIGYNHRYHPAIKKAKAYIGSKEFGEVLFIRARYGHGGRLGYEKEWRFDKQIAGGGELLDQGSHLIDLTNFFIGPCNQAMGIIGNLFWNAKLEDSGFLILKNNNNQIAHLSATCVEWKNIFVFEIMCRTAKLQINGLGKSYGKETLTIFKMKPEMGPPIVEELTFPEEDQSWTEELEEFIQAIENRDYSDRPLRDALYVLETIEKIYLMS